MNLVRNLHKFIKPDSSCSFRYYCDFNEANSDRPERNVVRLKAFYHHFIHPCQLVSVSLILTTFSLVARNQHS